MEKQEQLEEMEEIEREIYQYLQKQTEKVTTLKISQETRRSYQACQKYIMALQLKGLIVVEDYGNNKQIYIKR